MDLLAANATADFTGVVIAVADGDTVTIRTDGRKVRVRLNEIDAPERAQEWGVHSRETIDDLVYRRQVRVRSSGVDDYGRTLGKLYLTSTVAGQEIDVNAEMVRTGNAWAYRHYLRDKNLLTLEDEARRARRGLWSVPGAVPPWQFRHRGGTFEQLFLHSEPDTACGNKRYCRDMVNCEEAMMYLDCGITRIDSDGDGIPCEAICR